MLSKYSSFLLKLKDQEKMRQFHQKRKASFRIEKDSYILSATIYDEEYIPKVIREYVINRPYLGLKIHQGAVLLEKKIPSARNVRKEIGAFHKEAALIAEQLLEIENSHLIGIGKNL